MGRKKIPGLFKRNRTWHVDKCINGKRVCKSTGTSSLEEAERFVARLVEEERQARVYGVRPERTFEQAAAKYVLENQHKRTIDRDARELTYLMPWIGDVPINKLNIGTMQPWIEYRRKQGRATSTINHGIKMVRHILNLASGEWFDEFGLTWLLAPPKMKLLPVLNARKPYPLSWDEQDRLVRELPEHLTQMMLFAVNTGCRDSEVCGLRWDWEVNVPQLNTSVFIVPEEHVKNGDERLVVLNRVAENVVDKRRGINPTYVFTYRGRPMKKMLTTGWRDARTKVGLPMVRVHDLKHTFGRRLRAAGVSFEDRQDLLGHRSGRITTHYSAAELSNLINASNMVCDRGSKRPELVVLRRLNVV